MNEKKIIDLEEFIELVNEPIEIDCKTLGKLYFRRIFDDDFIFITNCLNENLDSEIFCKKLLLNQITNSSIELDDLNSLDNNEIYFILKEYFKIERIGENFDFNSSDDVYNIIKNGMINYVNYVNNIINSHQKAMFNYFSAIAGMVNDVINVIKPIMQLKNDIVSFWADFQNNYDISSLIAQDCLKKYHWFVSPNMDSYIIYDIVQICNSSSKSKRKEINDILINYFLDDNCKKLDMLVDNWSNNKLFNGRIKIIKDCVNLLKKENKDINCSNLIIPTLIAQIDGIQNEFMKINGVTLNHNVVFTSEGDKLKDENGNIIYKDDYFRYFTADNEFFDLMNDVFLDVLFQKTQPGEKYSSIHFSRHKILHGENINYGRKDYMIRCFLILDFLSELIFMDNILIDS